MKEEKMAEKSAVDVLNSHHTKLNDHTQSLALLQTRINELEKRVGLLETDHQPMKDFFKRINDWVGGLKD
jgi:hypothetical protein